MNVCFFLVCSHVTDLNARNKGLIAKLNKFEIVWYFSTYQSLRRLPLLKIANSQYFPVAPFATFIGSLMRLK